ncbi:hypothetical protein EDD22DRAFT_238675 [Suillus occidentalis]|nr:hypothetical protein EDD22DRAFT_238675 [Suillus occidentalis]
MLCDESFFCPSHPFAVPVLCSPEDYSFTFLRQRKWCTVGSAVYRRLPDFSRDRCLPHTTRQIRDVHIEEGAAILHNLAWNRLTTFKAILKASTLLLFFLRHPCIVSAVPSRSSMIYLSLHLSADLALHQGEHHRLSSNQHNCPASYRPSVQTAPTP